MDDSPNPNDFIEMNKGSIAVAVAMYSACLIIFQLCGFYPIPIKLNSNEKDSLISLVVSYGTSLIHFLLIAAHILYVVIRADEMLYSESVIGKINDILIYFPLAIAHLVIVIETFIERAYFRQYWSLYSKIVMLNRKSINVKWYRGYLMKFILYASFAITIELLVITNISGNDPQWARFWSAEIFSLLSTRFRNIQHIFFIDVIFFALQGTNQHTQALIRWAKAVGEDKKFCRKHLYIKMCRMKEQCKNLMEMIICVNKIFRWSQVLNIGQIFMEITVDLYWIYAYAKEDFFLLFATAIAPFPSVIVLLLLFQSATRCIKEIEEKTAFIIHNINFLADDYRLRTLIQDFSLLVKHSPKHFNANNCFVINFSLFTAMLSPMLTYLVIIISFHPK